MARQGAAADLAALQFPSSRGGALQVSGRRAGARAPPRPARKSAVPILRSRNALSSIFDSARVHVTCNMEQTGGLPQPLVGSNRLFDPPAQPSGFSPLSASGAGI